MIGERLIVARARARMTMRDVAQRCECTAQAVKKWEHDEAMPSPSKLIKLCEIYDVSMEWLFAPEPLDFHSTETAPQSRHAKYWLREALEQVLLEKLIGRGDAL